MPCGINIGPEVLMQWSVFIRGGRYFTVTRYGHISQICCDVGRAQSLSDKTTNKSLSAES